MQFTKGMRDKLEKYIDIKETFIGKVKWICKACRQVNGENDCCLN